MYNYKSIIFFSFILFMCSVNYGCNNSYDKKLDSFFSKLELSFDEKDLLIFQKSNEDSIKGFYYKYKNSFVEILKSENELDMLLIENGINKTFYKGYVLFKEFHRKLNNKDLKFLELIKDTQKKLTSPKKSLKDTTCYKERDSLVYKNLENLNEGDTIYLLFPIQVRNNIKNAVYLLCPSNYKSNSDTSLVITGVLLEKGAFHYGGINTLEPTFKIEIIELSQPNVPILMELYKPNDFLYVDLFSYGRKIISKSHQKKEKRL